MINDYNSNQTPKITKTIRPFYFDAATGTLNSTSFNSLSDITLKTDINTISNGINIVNQLRGVKFKWKSTNKRSIGVIAQEIETVLPEIVSSNNGIKSVSYDSIVGILIEAIKEQQAIINDLKDRIEILENK